MTVTYPEAVKPLGKEKFVVLTDEPADETAITLAEITAGIEASMYFVGQLAPGGSQNKGNSPRRAGESSQLQQLGNATYESPTLRVVFDPQGADADEANILKAALDPGSEVWIVRRVGLPVDTAFAATQKYKVHHLQLGEQFEAPSGDDEFAIEQITQETGYLTPPVNGVVAA